jgi:hypothetical protein
MHMQAGVYAVPILINGPSTLWKRRIESFMIHQLVSMLKDKCGIDAKCITLETRLLHARGSSEGPPRQAWPYLSASAAGTAVKL